MPAELFSVVKFGARGSLGVTPQDNPGEPEPRVDPKPPDGGLA